MSPEDMASLGTRQFWGSGELGGEFKAKGMTGDLVKKVQMKGVSNFAGLVIHTHECMRAQYANIHTCIYIYTALHTHTIHACMHTRYVHTRIHVYIHTA